MFRHFVLCVVFVTALSGCSESSSDSQNAASSPPSPTPAASTDLDVKTIGVSPSSANSDNKNWPCPATKDQLDKMTSALVSNDSDGYEVAVADGVALEPGTKVRILDRQGLGTTLHLRVLTGDDKGRDCWISGDADGLFVEGSP